MNTNILTIFPKHIFAGILSFIILSYPFNSYADTMHEQVVIIELEGFSRFVLTTPKGEKNGVKEYEVYQDSATADLSLSAEYQGVRITNPDSGSYEILLSSRYPDEITTAYVTITFINGDDPNIFFREWEFILAPGHEQKISFKLNQVDSSISFSDYMTQPTELKFLDNSLDDDSATLQWNQTPGAQTYEVYTKRENIDHEWNLLVETDENTFSLDSNMHQLEEQNSLYTEYTVVAQFSDTMFSPRSHSIFSHDRDGDYLPDDYEVANGTNPNEHDTDADGLIDSYEINIFHSDPTVGDTDDDGYSDFQEVQEYSGLLNQHSYPQNDCSLHQNMLMIEDDCIIDAEEIYADIILVNNSSTLELKNNSKIYLNSITPHIIIKEGGKIVINNSHIILDKF
jgi:hypothetical protein